MPSATKAIVPSGPSSTSASPPKSERKMDYSITEQLKELRVYAAREDYRVVEEPWTTVTAARTRTVPGCGA
jgi:hypothetical protein